MKRRSFLGMSLAVGMAVCSGTATAAERSIETALGPRRLATEPAPLVVLDVAAIDTLDALGVTIDAMPAPNYVGYLADVFEAAAHVGSLFEPDYEQIATMAPGLIVAGGRSARQVAPLSAIAPTIDMTIGNTDQLATVRARIAAYGALFGRTAAAEALTGALDAKIAQASDAVRGKGNALILLTNGGKISAYGGESRFGWLHRALELPEAHPGLTAEVHGQPVSFEFIAELNPDWILVIDRGAAVGQAGEAAAATLDNPLVNGTDAAQAGRIVYLDPAPLYIAGGGVQSMMATLDEVIAAFGPAAE